MEQQRTDPEAENTRYDRIAGILVIALLMFTLLVLFAVGCVIAARFVLSRWAALDGRQRLHLILLFLSVAVFLASAMSFVAFFAVSVVIGGDATAGRIENGRYYVSSHGRLTEVSPEVWGYSRIHAEITWATSLLGAVGLGVVMLSGHVFGRRMPNTLTITVTREGAVLVDGETSGVEDAADRAALAWGLRVGITLRRDYPTESPPAEAVRLCQELVGKGVPFQTVDRPA